MNWLDMRKTLLLADERALDDPTELDTQATQRLTGEIPCCRELALHDQRVNALLAYVKSNHVIFGGQVKDYSWRIEFQNHGSPHLQMLTGISEHPSFETAEGIRQLDKVCSCEMPFREYAPA